MATVGQLTRITAVADLKDLQILYLKDWPSNCVGYFWLDNYLRWLHQNPTLKHLNFYTLDNDWRSDGLFILVHRYQLFFSNLSKQKTDLEVALKQLDWSGGFKVSAIHEIHHKIYKQVALDLGLHMDREMNTIMYILNREEAERLQIQCPDGYYLDKVRLEHADLINNLWSARHPGSLKLIQMLITYNTNVGLYEKESGSLCAWCLRLQSGFLGALEVLPTHQRRGLGLVVAAAISKAIATDLQQDITALVNMNNSAACRVFEKLNFRLIQDEHYYWSMIKPAGGGQISWPCDE
ncbi:uncharacterized protein Dsimw501_GD24132 [Drosophila simulans]|uniref:N-acetyltransferase domain-containing protein n=1 Tax=Drosophila simulans TaxID=7240 RepID=A0A0J9TQF0_DROSI|nr:uncharacterized protein LOC6732656 [Drosophila simulans]KMY90780.1 uncharacterized protein Dsimw501_GD24132 [Drosophila simulans]